MTDPRPRPILRLKTIPARPAAPPPPAPASRWKCRPCGAAVEVGGAAPVADPVRCPACNARLGKAEHFLSDPPDLARIRARPV